MPQPAILCDIGNVIVTFDFRIASRRLAASSDCPEDALFDRLHHLKLPFEDGQIDNDTFVTQAIDAIGYRDTPSKFAEIWCDIFAPNHALIATLEHLAHTHPLYLLSNTSGLHKDYLFAQFPVFQLFSGGVYSYSAQTSKPEPQIFRLAIEQFNLDPAQTFYIDDLLPNIETAGSLGLVVHHYDPAHHARLESALHQWTSQQG